jgi:hypothetical protein
MTVSNSLILYRKLLKLANNLPSDKRTSSIQRIKEEFRKNASQTDSKTIEDLLKYAQSSLGYLKIVTPKRQMNQNGQSKVVFGVQAKFDGKAVSNWTGNNMDPDAVKRHYNSLKRAGFKTNQDAKGFF